jgi:hypothetical protein
MIGRQVLVLLKALHRYVGALLCLLVFAWFCSGIVMMYKGYPLLGEAEKLARTPALAASSVVLPIEAWSKSGQTGSPAHVRLALLEQRPVYVFALGAKGWVTVAADSGAPVASLDAKAAERIAKQFSGSNANVQYLGLNTAPNQWTMFALWAPYMADYSFAPFHQFALEDANQTQVSVLAATGDVIQETVRSERLWGYLGAVVHWIYPTALRRNVVAWDRTVVWSSMAAALLCVVGLVIGLTSYRWKRQPQMAGSPYRNWLKWHHYLGLVFGLLALTWLFSGLLSMDPWKWSLTDDTPDGSQQSSMRGGDLNLAAFSATPSEALVTCNRTLTTKEIRLVQLRGEPYYWCVESPQRSLLLDARAHSEATPIEQLPVPMLLAATKSLYPERQVIEAQLIEHYDAYYYPGWYDKLINGSTKRLPVLRVNFDGENPTTVYVDPYSASPVLTYDTSARWFRWLFHGLHSLDFGALYRTRPLWDFIVLPLMLLGVAFSVTGVWISAKWVARKVR